MFSSKEKRRQDTRTSDRNRNLEAMVRLTHQTMTRENAEPDTALAKPDLSTAPLEQPWEEMVFEHRNKAYGAYVLRKGYSNNVTIGLIVTIIVVMFLIFYPRLSKFFGSDDVVARPPLRKLVYTELSAPPPIDKPKPAPPQIILPRLQKVIKFVPPKVVKEEVVELPPTIEEIKVNETGAVAVEGPTEVIFDAPVEEVVVDDNELFTVVDQQPEFEGGYNAMMAFIKQNMVYPANARRMQIEGTVHLSFIVSKTGTISEVKVLRGIMTECDKEAVRVVQLMPLWKPGKQNGRNVNVRFILPLKFRLN
ncbi:MAG: TonB family protein [Cyclobacteriaceae bacterium]